MLMKVLSPFHFVYFSLHFASLRPPHWPPHRLGNPLEIVPWLPPLVNTGQTQSQWSELILMQHVKSFSDLDKIQGYCINPISLLGFGNFIRFFNLVMGAYERAYWILRQHIHGFLIKLKPVLQRIARANSQVYLDQAMLTLNWSNKVLQANSLVPSIDSNLWKSLRTWSGFLQSIIICHHTRKCWALRILSIIIESITCLKFVLASVTDPVLRSAWPNWDLIKGAWRIEFSIIFPCQVRSGFLQFGMVKTVWTTSISDDSICRRGLILFLTMWALPLNYSLGGYSQIFCWPLITGCIIFLKQPVNSWHFTCEEKFSVSQEWLWKLDLNVLRWF